MVQPLTLSGTDDIRVRRELSELLDQQTAVDRRIAELQNAAGETPAVSAAPPGDNLLRNTEAEFSDDAYNNLGLGGDAAKRIAHWYLHADSATLLAFTSAELLKDSTHSGYVGASDDPDWEKTAGRIRLGTLKTVSQPLVNRLAQQGNILFLQFTATLRTATALPSPLIFYAGIHDNTVGQEKWVSGATLALIATVEGTPGGTTRDYRVIETTDKGETYQIDMAPIVNAPNAPSTTNFVRLNWPAIPGRVSARVEKSEGGVFSLLTTITSGSTEFNDYGDAGEVIGAFTTGTLTAIRARIQDNAFVPEYGVIKTYAYAIGVPSDYNISLTTGGQVLRLGISAGLTDDHQLILDRFSLGFNFGGFQRSAADIAVSNLNSVTASPTGGLAPAPTGDGGTPPVVGSGGVRPRPGPLGL
jgi:hypothetical protein